LTWTVEFDDAAATLQPWGSATLVVGTQKIRHCLSIGLALGKEAFREQVKAASQLAKPQ